MSAIILEWLPAEIGAEITVLNRNTERYAREEEFQAPLSRHIAAYVADQRNRVGAIGDSARSERFRGSAVAPGLRRVQAASRVLLDRWKWQLHRVRVSRSSSASLDVAELYRARELWHVK